MSVLLAFCFAGGVALIWFGAVCKVELAASRVQRRAAGLPSPIQVGTGMTLAVVGALVAWSFTAVPALALIAALAGAYMPLWWRGRRRQRARRDREQAWPAALAQLADGLEAGLAFPAAVALVADSGPLPLRSELSLFHTRLRSSGLEAALDGLGESKERTADTVALLLRAGLLELPAGGLAPVMRELTTMLTERAESREKARSRASTLQIEAAILALSPIALLLLIGASSPGYLDAYRNVTGTVVSLIGSALIFGCYLLMRQLGQIPEPRRTEARR